MLQTHRTVSLSGTPGIGGIGISALAQLCLEKGYEIQGSDLSKSEIWPILETKKIPVFLEQVSENITENISTKLPKIQI